MRTVFSPVRALTAALALAVVAGGPPVLAASGSGGGGGGGSGSTSASASTTSGSGDVDMPGEIMVKLRRADGLASILSTYPVTLVSRFGSRPIYRLKVVGAARVKDVIAALTLDANVMLAETNPTNRDPEARKNAFWTIGSATAYAAQWAPQAMHLAEAQRVSTGAGVRVAVLDTGVDRNHPLLAGRLLPGFDFVDFDNDPSEVGPASNPGYGHGTHVAGLVALAAPGAQIMPIRVLDTNGVGNAWVLAEALLYAIDPDGNPATNDGAQVINMSLGSLARTRLFSTIAQLVACAPATPDDPVGDRSDPGYADDEARCANGNAAVVVAAAGNDASKSVKEYPAAEGAYGLISVAASAASAHLAGFSNFGPWVDIAAPGDGITSALPGGVFGTWSGTSMASPLVAGTAALVRSAYPAEIPTDVVKRLKRSASVLCGSAIPQVDANAALLNAAPATLACP